MSAASDAGRAAAAPSDAARPAPDGVLDDAASNERTPMTDNAPTDERAASAHAAPALSRAPGSPTAEGVVVLVEVVDRELKLDAHEQAVAERRAGAVVSFQGVVRDHDHGRSVDRLDYEGHPSAEAVLREVAEEIAADPDVYAVAVSHRVGSLRIGDVALVAAVSTAHRAAAFAACARLVDEAKARLPIWKHQVFDDGSDEWVNCP
jgi:molybdopterin synthase catalytic subunit